MTQVSLASTTRKYRGRMAETYEEKRTKQARWHQENAAVAKLLEGAPGASHGRAVLDVPFGTGRFIKIYRDMGLSYTGVDVSEDMLMQARSRMARSNGYLYQQDVLDFLGEQKDKYFLTTVCVRFLDLIDQDAMKNIVREICRVTRERIILTIRLGLKYEPKVNTATHDEKRFWKLVSDQGWELAEKVSVFSAGWYVVKLRRHDGTQRPRPRGAAGSGEKKTRRRQG